MRRQCDGRVHWNLGANRKEGPCSRHGYRNVGGKLFCFHHAEIERNRIAVKALQEIAAVLHRMTDEEIEGAPGEATGIAFLALDELGEPENAPETQKADAAPTTGRTVI